MHNGVHNGVRLLSNIVRIFLVMGLLFTDISYANTKEGEDSSSLSLLKSAVSSGVDPIKLLQSRSMDANSMMLSSQGKKNNVLRRNVSKQNSDSSEKLEELGEAETLRISASTLPNNAGEMSEKDKYFGQHELCESEIVKAEQKYGIPKRLLLAISTVESGRAVGKSKRPWPWTICANGRGYYCSTKSAAIATTKRLMARGIRNIDVGCMQVNLLHHSTAFKNLEEAFTPRANVNYAARFFIKLRNLYSSWTHAVGYYHSKLAKHYKPYCTLVYNAWNKVKNIPIRNNMVITRAASKIKSDISFLPSYYSLVDNNISAKLHQLGKKTLVRSVPKFFAGSKKKKTGK